MIQRAAAATFIMAGIMATACGEADGGAAILPNPWADRDISGGELDAEDDSEAGPPPFDHEWEEPTADEDVGLEETDDGNDGLVETDLLERDDGGEQDPDDDAAAEQDAPDPAFCDALDACPGERVCNLALGRCEERSTVIDQNVGLTAFHPPAGARGDLLAIDGTRFFTSLVGNFSVKVWIGATQATFADFVAWDENRLLIRVPSGASGVVGVQAEGGAFVQSATSFGALSAGVVACDGSTPAPTGAAPGAPTHLGPYAAGHLDYGNDGMRVYYPAQCGSLRRPAVSGTFPLVALLHGNGAAHVNYEYLGQLLASRGLVVVNPPSTHTNSYDEEVIDKLYSDVNAFLGKDLSALHPALAGAATTGDIAFICHSRGCGRQQEMMGDYPRLAAQTKASVFLGPANLDAVVPGHFLVIGATADGQSFPANYNGQYSRQSAPKWKVVVNGGNHSLFADAKVYYAMDGVPTITRKRQLTIVASFVMPLLERAFGMTERHAAWLDQSPASVDYTVESAP